MDSADLARSGMGTAQQRLHAHAHNLAELSTEGFRRSTVAQAEQAGGGTTAAWERAPAPGHAWVDDLVGQPMAGHAFTAHLAVFKTRDAMAGALLDAVA